MKKATLLFLLGACLIGGMMTPAAGRKAAPAIRVAPDRALVDEVVSVSISGLSQGQAATVKATLTEHLRSDDPFNGKRADEPRWTAGRQRAGAS